MKIAIGCDHGGIVLKPAILDLLQKKGIEVQDFGTYNDESVDYPDYALKVAEAVSEGSADAGILLCGTGIGISMAANKVKGIRAAVIHDEFCAMAAKEHNNANVITMGGRVISPEKAAVLVGLWLNTEFAGGRHQRRIDKITDIETKYFK